MTGSNNTAAALGPFQQAMKVHQSIQSSASSRVSKQSSRPRSATKQPPLSQTTTPQPAHDSQPPEHLPAKVSPELSTLSGRLSPHNSPAAAPVQSLPGSAPGALPLSRITTATPDAKIDPTAPRDPSETPPRQRAPLRAAATRSQSPFSPQVPSKDVGPFQASASLFQKKSKGSKSSKSRSRSTSQSTSGSNSREHRSKRFDAHSAQQHLGAVQQQHPQRHIADLQSPEGSLITTETFQQSPVFFAAVPPVGKEQLVPALPQQGMLLALPQCLPSSLFFNYTCESQQRHTHT